MAIAIVGTPTVAEVASGTAITVSYPTTVTSGNLLILSITNSTATAPATTPSGWSSIVAQNGIQTASVSVYYKVADGTETGSFLIDPVASTAGRLTALMTQWSGVNTSIPMDTSVITNTNGSATTFTTSGITSLTDNALIYYVIAMNSSSTVQINDPDPVATGITLRTGSTGTGRMTKVYTEPKTPAGATGTRSWTNTGTALQWTGITMALRPASTGGAVNTPVLTRCVNDIPTTTSMTFSINTTDAMSVAIKTATNSGMTTNVATTSTVTPDGQGNSVVTVNGLTSNTNYYYRVVMQDGNSNPVEDNWTLGQFKTDSNSQMNFSFAFGSCTNATDSTAMSAIATKKPDLFFHLGDEYYADGSGTSLANFRAKLIAKKTATNHKAVYRTSGVSFIASDHDGMNNNTNNGTDPTAWTNYNTAYREINSNVDLPATKGLYRSFKRGRVRFIRIDRRSFATTPSATDDVNKTCLGATQKQWLKDQITNAAEPLIIIQQGEPWIGSAQAGDDGWFGYTTERQELGNFFFASGKNIAIIGGDMHALAADNGSNSVGGVAVFQASPLNNATSVKGGPYSTGTYPASGSATVEQYGWMDVTDTGSQISLAFTGYSADNTSRITLTKNYTVPVSYSATANFTGSGTLTAVKSGAGGTANFTGAGTLTSSKSLAISRTANLTSTGTLTATGSATVAQINNAGLYVVRGGALRQVISFGTATAPQPPVIGNWTLAFEDLFVGPTLSNKWAKSWFNGGTMNNVTTSANNVSIENDTLKLVLSSTSVGALINTDPVQSPGNGGFSFTLGYAEARIKFLGPDDTHIYNWPAWWTDGQPVWPANGEHDIAEAAGWAGANNKLSINYHGQNTDGSRFDTALGTVPGIWSNGWHKYAVHRKIGSADYYYDDQKVFTTVTKDNQAPQFLILNIGNTPQVAYQMIGDAGAMFVDHVRVWTPTT